MIFVRGLPYHKAIFKGDCFVILEFVSNFYVGDGPNKLQTNLTCFVGAEELQNEANRFLVNFPGNRIVAKYVWPDTGEGRSESF